MVGKQKQLCEAFCAYIEACKKLSPVLWDSIASEDLLKLHAKHAHFINKFHLRKEYKYLLKTLENWDNNKPDEENVTEYYHEYYDYKHRVSSCLKQFFVNTGIYDIIIAGKGSEINNESAFYIFFNELNKKEIEFMKYGEVFPLRIEMEKGRILEFDDFSLLADMSRYSIDDWTKFVFLLKRFSLPNHLGMPKEGVPVDMGSFSISLLLLNLYFEHPLCIREWHESYESLLSTRYQPKRYVSESCDPVWNNYFAALNDKYHFDAIQAADVDGYTDWDKFGDFMFQKEEEFIKNGQAPVNYLKTDEVAKFEKFIKKAQEFLKSDLYKKQKYLQIAARYYLMAHEKPDIGETLVNYMIALEALYFAHETDELKEKLANRIANLLGRNSEQKGKIKADMLESYNKRCDYVHGKSFDIPKQYNHPLRNTLRISLLSFFGLSEFYNSNAKREQLLKSLDSVFDMDMAENIQIQAADFLSLARPYIFLNNSTE